MPSNVALDVLGESFDRLVLQAVWGLSMSRPIWPPVDRVGWFSDGLRADFPFQICCHHNVIIFYIPFRIRTGHIRAPWKYVIL